MKSPAPAHPSQFTLSRVRKQCRRWWLAALTTAALAVIPADNTRAADASLDVGAFGIDSTSRTLPAVLNTKVDIGTFTFTGNTGSLAIAVNVGSTNYSVAKRYVIPMSYNMNGTTAFLKVLPAFDTGAYAGNDFDLDVKVTQGTMTLRLRVAATDGTNAGTANIVIESTGVATIKYLTAAAVVAPPNATQVFTGSVLTQLAGRVGVNGAPAVDAALDINGGNTKGLRLRPRTVNGAPTTGPWSKGTLIVDAGGNLYLCTADGTPGTWKKVTP